MDPVKQTYINPSDHIKSFHVHLNGTEEELPQLLTLKEDLHRYLDATGVVTGRADTYTPDYGPHKEYTSEIEIEVTKEGPDMVEKLGLAFSWLVVNAKQNKVNAFVHTNSVFPGRDRMDDVDLEDHLNPFLIGDAPALDNDFFVHPPRDADGKFIPTGPKHRLSAEAVAAYRAKGVGIEVVVRDPKEVLKGGIVVELEAEGTAGKVEVLVQQLQQYFADSGFGDSIHSEGIIGTKHVVRISNEESEIQKNLGMLLGFLRYNKDLEQVVAIKACDDIVAEGRMISGKELEPQPAAATTL